MSGDADNPFHPPDPTPERPPSQVPGWLALAFGVVSLASYTVGPGGTAEKQMQSVISAVMYYLPAGIAAIVLGSWKLKQGRQRPHGMIAIGCGVLGLIGLGIAALRFAK